MIRSLDFYQSMKNKLAEFDQLTQIKAKVNSIDENGITTEVQSYHGDLVFSSIYNPKA